MSWQRLRSGSWLWQVNTAFMDSSFLKRLESPEHLMHPPAEPIERMPPRTLTDLVRLVLPEWPSVPLFIKRYKAIRFLDGCKYVFRRSRARLAFENAFLVQQLNLRTATPVAVGERRRRFWIREAYLLCAAVPNSTSLYHFYEGSSDSRQRLRAVRALARVMAKLHDAHLSHSDPHALNFLVSNSDCRNLVMIDLDALRHPVWFTFRTALKDLSKMLARSPLSVREQLWFAAEYCRSRTPRLSARELVRALSRVTVVQRCASAQQF